MLNDELLEEYERKFGDRFPTFVFRCYGAEEINQMVKECIDSGEPIKLEPDALY